MKNKLSDLKNHLCPQLGRLSQDGLKAQKIEQEAQRTDAIVAAADQVTRKAEPKLNAATLFANHADQVLPLSPQIGKASE